MDFSLTLVIIVGTAIMSWRAFQDRAMFEKMLYSPFLVNHQRQWYRMGTHGLIHSDWMHLAMNMWWLWMFGAHVEDGFSSEYYFGGMGPMLYLLLYVGGVFFAALPGFIRHRENHMYRSVGASGATSAVLFAYIIMAPAAELHFFFLPAMPAWVFGLGYLALEWYLDKRGRDNIAHDAHYWGALFGVGYVIALRPETGIEFVRYLMALIS